MAKQFGFGIEIELPASIEAGLRKATEQAMKEVAAELDGRYTEAISGSYWVWPRQSKRGVSGSTLSEVAKNWRRKNFTTGSPRSIVDSGDLKSSSVHSVKGLSAEWIWSVEYAAAVHDGAWVYPWANNKAAKMLLPARPWTEAVLRGHPHYSGEVYDFSTRLSQAIARYANG